MDVIHPAIMVH